MSTVNQPEDKDSSKGIIGCVLSIGALVFVLFIIIEISDGIQYGLNSIIYTLDKIPKWLWIIIMLPILGIIFHITEKK